MVMMMSYELELSFSEILNVSIVDRYGKVYTELTVDSDEFAKAEYTARAFADAYDCEMCIKWSRASDGQVGYWGPQGACFEPYWYEGKHEILR